ncbi:LPXTG cell wall anchor domain-containing protein [Fundicoccus sp. Sow4_F4]|uniref:LPXTG cell wall anchor domain-containing protein n=1 Tax=Fundicoccus sp. Sow4_F4 TaxID=3438783 RepID=UPI003F904DF4
MNMKKILFVSASTLALGTVSANVNYLGDALGMAQASIVYAQELTPEQEAQVAQIKDTLAGLEPVNLEQLLSVSDQDLLTYFNDASAASTDSAVIYKAVYDSLAANYLNLGLLTGENYDAYRRAAEAIVAGSSYSFSDLNTALPSDILAWYQTEFATNEQNVEATVAAILPQITVARDAYIERRDAREAEAAEAAEAPEETSSEEETPEETSSEDVPEEDSSEEEIPSEEAPEETDSEETTPDEEPSSEEEPEESDSTEVPVTDLESMKASLVEYTFITEAGLTYFDETVLNTYLPIAVENNFSAESALVIQDRLVSERPDLFTGEQIQEVANKVRVAAIAETPMLQTQAEEIPIEALLAYNKVINTSENGVEYLFNRSIEDYPEVFADEADRFRTVLNEEYQLNADDLAVVPDVSLIWEEYYTYLQAGGAEDFQELAAVMEAKYEVSREEESSEAESESETEETALDGFKAAVVSQTDITNDQLAALGDETLQATIDTFGFDIEDTTEGNAVGFRRMLITYYPDNFTSEQVNSEANLLRETSVNLTPMTMDIANQIPSGDFLAWNREAIDAGGNDMTYPFQRAVEEYPDLFTDLVIQAKQDLIGNTALTQAQVDQMKFVDLLFANFSADAEVDYAAAEQHLRELYPAVFESDAASETSSETGTESESDSTSVSVSKSTDVEAGDQPTLPNTGETSSWWIGGVAVILIAVAGYLIYRGRKAN